MYKYLERSIYRGMKSHGILGIYIKTTPKRWCVARAHRTLTLMTRLSTLQQLGFSMSGGPHEGIGTHTNFVLSLIFASEEDKAAYEQDRMYQKLLKDLKRYTKKDKLVLF